MIFDIAREDEINLSYPKNKAKLSIALCFPNNYKLGTSNLGFLSIYKYLNQNDNFRCERFYFDPEMSIHSTFLKSFETNRPLKDFDCLAFSLSFEIDLVNIIRTIINSGLEVYSINRKDDSPYIIMGGIVASINPEPAAHFIDTFVIGDGEEVTVKLLELYLDYGKKQFDSRFQLEASKLEGVYFPSSIEFKKDNYGIITDIKVRKGFPEEIKGNFIRNIDDYKTYSPIISKETNFSSCCLIDIMRGCKKDCSFCVTGNICSPMRVRSLENIRKIIEEMKGYTCKFGLIASSLTYYPDLEGLVSLMETYGIKYTLASFRLESMKEDVIKLIKSSNQRTITIAPEAGSERLRKYLGKTLSDNILLGVFQKLLDEEFLNYKLYYMVGIPSEKQEDLEGIVTTIKKMKHLMLKKAKGTKKMGNITISSSCFVPKPGTPFENMPMDNLSNLKWK
ncbi:radical SAM protein, partial [bacterium]|nr:radical SAM protein [bacterium]